MTMRRRILFVDDEAAVLDGIGKAQRKQRARWDMVFAVGGPAALAQLREPPFDVVVVDMQMPEVDGAALLASVQERDPSTIRIILTGFADRDAVVRALPIAHQFFNKPCAAPELAAAIDRACELRDLFTNPLVRAVVGRLVKLPTTPRIYHELLSALARPQVHLEAVAELVEQDPAMVARIMQIASSSFFGFSQPLVSIKGAVARLGTEMIASLALASHAFGAVGEPTAPGFSIDALQVHSLAVAQRARAAAVAAAEAPATAAAAFTAGLVHDLGKLIIAAAMPAEYAEIQRRGKLGEPAAAIERAVLRTSHAEIGAYLLGLWGLPLPIIDAVARHDDPGAPASPLLTALRQAHTQLT